MPKLVEMPDGKIIEFPDKMSDAEISKVLDVEYGGVKEKPSLLMSQAQKASKTGLEDILQPLQLGEPPMKEQMGDIGLPVAGATAGAFGGAPLGPGGSIAGAMLLGGAGRSAGQLYNRYILGRKPPTLPQQINEPLEEMLYTAAGEATGLGVAYGAKKVLAPFAKKMTKEAKIIAEKVAKYKVPLSPDIYAPYKGVIVKPFQWITDLFPAGRAWSEHKRNQIAKGFLKMRNDLISQLPRQTDKMTAGMELAGEIKEEAIPALKEARKIAYEAWEGAVPKDTEIPMKNTVKYLKELYEQILPDPKDQKLKMLQRIWGQDKGTIWTASDVDSFQRQVWGGDKAFKKNTSIRGNIIDEMKKDLALWEKDQTVKVLDLLEAAKDSHKTFKGFTSNPTVKAIMKKYATDPENIILVAFSSGNLDDVAMIKNAVSDEVWDAARSRFIQNMIDIAVDETGTVFNPTKFVQVYSRYRQQIQNAMPEIFDQIDAFAKMAHTAMRDVQRSASFSGPASNPILKSILGGQALGSMAGVAYGRPEILVPQGFSFIVSKSLMNPSGWLRRWLTEGTKRTLLPQMLEYGARTAIQTQKPNLDLGKVYEGIRQGMPF